MKKLYADLYYTFSSEKLASSSHFVSMKGKYFNDSAVNNGIRLMIIGRAVNGWTTLDTRDANTFGEATQKSFDAEGFTWIDDSGDTLCNRPQDGEPTYHLSKSPFWRTSKNIWEGLSEKHEKNWLNYIAWSNIYKIAPLLTGNPTTKMCISQINICRDILKVEIETYKPTHILFVTGYEWWFYDKTGKCGVSNLFDEPVFYEKNTKENCRYVEGSAHYTFGDGKSVPVVITCRPERRPENDFVEQVLAHYKQLTTLS